MISMRDCILGGLSRIVLNFSCRSDIVMLQTTTETIWFPRSVLRHAEEKLAHISCVRPRIKKLPCIGDEQRCNACCKWSCGKSSISASRDETGTSRFISTKTLSMTSKPSKTRKSHYATPRKLSFKPLITSKIIWRMSFFNPNIVGFRRVYYENWSSQSPGKLPWVPALSRQPRSSHAVARCSWQDSSAIARLSARR